MLKFLLLAVLLPAVAYGRVEVHPCTNSFPGNTPPVPAWVEVEGCSGTTCNIPNGRSTDLSAAFAPTTSHEIVGFHVRVFLILTGFEVPIPQPPGIDYGCPLIDGGCPITAGQGETAAHLTFESLDSPLNGLTVRIEVNLRDLDTMESVVCGGVTVTITAPV